MQQDSLMYDSLVESQDHDYKTTYRPRDASRGRNDSKERSVEGLPHYGTKNYLKAGYVDPEWTAKIKQRLDKKSKKPKLNDDQKQLLEMNKSIQKNIREGSIDDGGKIMNMKLAYGMHQTMRDVKREGLSEVVARASPERSRSPEQS